MSIALDSSDYITRTANLPLRTAYTIGGWVYINTFPSASRAIFSLEDAPGNWQGTFYYSGSQVAFRVANDGGGTNFAAGMAQGNWYYMFLRCDGTNLNGGWKDIDDTSFTTSANVTRSETVHTKIRIGADTLNATAMDMLVFRLSVWDEYVSDANLLTAAATDLGYTTNINTHIAGTATGDPARYADSSGNSRDWTASGTISDGSNPTFGSAFIPRRMMLGVG